MVGNAYQFGGNYVAVCGELEYGTRPTPFVTILDAINGDPLWVHYPSTGNDFRFRYCFLVIYLLFPNFALDTTVGLLSESESYTFVCGLNRALGSLYKVTLMANGASRSLNSRIALGT